MKKYLTALAFLFLAGPLRSEIGGIVTFPDGTSGEVQFEQDGLFTGTTNFTYSTDTHRLNVQAIQWPDGTVQVSSPSAGGGGSGDAILAATQTWTGANAYLSSSTFKNVFISTYGAHQSGEGMQIDGDGDLWITANAYYDGTNWMRIDTSKVAFGFELIGKGLFPFEVDQGAALWVCDAGANPIGTSWGSNGSWEIGWDMTSNRDLVIGGYAIEMDGHGTLPYGRLVHVPVLGSTHTGIVTNIFGDFSGVDSTTTYSWYFGREDDAFVIKRATPTAITSFTNLVTVSTSAATFANVGIFGGSGQSYALIETTQTLFVEVAGSTTLVVANGKVGINTTNPPALLSVETGGGSPVFHAADSGVGIGITNPNYSLQVLTSGNPGVVIQEAAPSMNTALTFRGHAATDDGERARLGTVTSASGQRQVVLQSTSSLVPLVLQGDTSGGGNVGISTSIVQYTLDVGGDVNFTGNLYDDGGATFSVVGGKVAIATTTYTYGLNLGDDVRIDNNQNIYFGNTPSAQLGWNSGGFLFMGLPQNALGLVMTTNSRFRLLADSGMTAGSGAAQLTLSNTGDFTFAQSTSGTAGNVMYADIGDSTNNGSNDGDYVWGDHYNQTASADGAFSFVTGLHGRGGAGLFILTDSSGTNVPIQIYQNNPVGTTTENLLRIDAAKDWRTSLPSGQFTGNFFTFTTSNTARATLNHAGVLNLFGTGGANFLQLYNSDSLGLGVLYNSTYPNAWWSANTGTAPYRFYSSDAARYGSVYVSPTTGDMVLGADIATANVGISTSSPVTKLAVDGGITATSSITAQSGMYSTTGYFSGKVGIGGSNSGTNQLEVYATDINGILLQNNSSNSRLRINAQTDSSIVLDTNRNGGSTSQGSLMWLHNGSQAAGISTDHADSNKLKIDTGSSVTSTTGIVIDSGHDVGIGTADPTFKLHVTDTDGANAFAVNSPTFTITSGNVGIGTSSPVFPLDISQSGTQSGFITRDINISHTLDPSSNQIHFNIYTNAINTGSTDNTANAAHFGGALFRSSDTSLSGTDAITVEARNDARSLLNGIEETAILGYIDLVATAPANGTYYAIRARPCASTDGDCGTDTSTGTLYGVYIENVQGGANTSRAFMQVGTDDYNVFLGSVTSFGSNTLSNSRVQIVQAGGGDLKPALALFSGGASDYVLKTMGRTGTENYDAVVGAANSFANFSAAGDRVIVGAGTSNDIILSVGLNADPEIHVQNSQVIFRGADNSTLLVASISATQANITGSDTFISFNSNTGQEGNVIGTGSAGVLAFNTFTGSHWTKFIGKAPEILAPICSNGNTALFGEGTAPKEQLVESVLCGRKDKGILGFYGGRDDKKRDMALALGTGFAWVKNTGRDIEIGDWFFTSGDGLTVEAQEDDIQHNYSAAKASQPIKWKKGEKMRKIAVTYHAG